MGDNFTLPPVAGPTTTAATSLPLPHQFIVKYKLDQAQSALSYTSSTGAHRPETGKELYDAILQSKLPPAAQDDLVSQFFGQGFNPSAMKSTERDAYFNAVTYNPQFLRGNLGALSAPDPATLALATHDTLVTQAFTERYAGQSKSVQQLALELSKATAYEQQSAYGVVTNYLDNWGLQEDAPYVYKMITHNGANLINTDQILNAIRGRAPSGLGAHVDQVLKANYESQFAGLTAYNSQPGQVHMTETQYQTYTQAIQDAAQQFGQVRLNQAQIGKLLNGNVSASEFSQRVQDIGTAVANADAGTKQILQKQFGINPHHLFAYFADPKHALPDMQRAVASGEIQDYANRVGLAGLTPAGGNQLADMAKLSATQGNNPLGVGVSNIENSLLTASKDVPLTAALPGESRPTVNTNTLVGSQLAGFGGSNQRADQVAVERAAQAKVAPFEKGGGFAADSQGVVGVGSAST
jgi:hypothetical protein